MTDSHPALGESGRGAMLRRLARELPLSERRNAPVRCVRDALAAWLGIDPAALGRLEPQTLGRMAASMSGLPPVGGVTPLESPTPPPRDRTASGVPERRAIPVRLMRDAVAARLGVHPSAIGTLEPETVSRIAARFGIQRVRIQGL